MQSGRRLRALPTTTERMNVVKMTTISKAVIGAALLGSCSLIGTGIIQAAPAPVSVNWYYPEFNTAVPPNQNQVQAAVNRITEKAIGVKVHLIPIPGGGAAYPQKLSVMLETGQATGIVWTSSWSLPWTNEVAAKAFLPLNSLIAKYGRGLTRTLGTKFLKGMAYNGTIYAIPNLQIEAYQPQLDGEITASEAKALNLQLAKLPGGAYEPTKIHTFPALHAFLVNLHKKYPKQIPLVTGQFGTVLFPETYGYWAVLTGTTNPFFVKMQPSYGKNPPKITLALNMFRQYIAMLHNWYQQGLINQDAGDITATEAHALQATGTEVLESCNGVPAWNPGNEASGVPKGYLPINLRITEGPLHGAPIYTGDASTANAIAAATPAPQRMAAMKLLNLVNTDSQLYNLIAFGFPKVDYKKIGPNSIVFTAAGAKYFANDNWAFGNVTRGYTPTSPAYPKFSWKVMENINHHAVASPLVGFNFNTTPVQTQLADMAAVEAQWNQPLLAGVYPVSKLSKFEAAMNAAGQQVVLKALTRQFDAWWKATHK